MRFEFEGSLGQSLRVVPEIVEGRLIELRGRNGIGKSMALSLLALCAGAENPWATQQDSWRSLKAAIPDGYAIRGIDPDGHEIIQWVLKPSTWPDNPDHWSQDKLGEVSVAGNTPAPHEFEPGHPIEVVRLSGKESLLDVLKDKISRDLGSFEVQYSHASAALNHVFNMLAQLHEDLEASSTDKQDELAERVKLIGLQLTEVTEAREALADDLRAVAELDADIGRLKRAEVALPGLRARQEALSTERSELGKQKAKVEQRLQTRTSTFTDSFKKREELERHNRNAHNRQRAWERAMRNLKDSLRHPSISDVLVNDLPSETRRTRREINHVRSRIMELTSQAPVLDLARNIQAVCAESVAADAELLFKDESGNVTVGRLREGVTGRIQTERVREPGSTLNDLRRDEKKLRERLDALDRAAENARTLAQKEKLVVESQVAAVALREAPEFADISADLQRQEELLKKISEVDRELFQVDLRIQALLEGSESLTALRDRVDQAERALAGRTKGDLKQALDEAAARYLSLNQDKTLLDAELRDARVAAEAAGKRLESQGLVLESAAQRQSAADRASRAQARYEEMREQLDHARQAHQTLLAHLDGEREDPRSDIQRRMLYALAKRYDQRLRDQYDTQAFRDALFDGGRLTEIDLIAGWFRWETGGKSVQRPLQALSSGQMVFAYTKAKIGELQALPHGTHRLVALDEFGAFLDPVHRANLLSDLRHHVMNSPHTKVLLVLPYAPENDLGYEFNVLVP